MLILTTILQVAINGSLNVLRQAEQAGVTNFAYVSSIATVGNYTAMDEVSDKSMSRTQVLTAVLLQCYSPDIRSAKALQFISGRC